MNVDLIGALVCFGLLLLVALERRTGNWDE